MGRLYPGRTGIRREDASKVSRRHKWQEPRIRHRQCCSGAAPSQIPPSSA